MLHEGHKPVISTDRELDALQIGVLHEGQKPITDRAPYDTLPGLGTEGIPHEGHWSCISRDADTTQIISAQHTVYSMRVTSQPPICSGAGHQNRSGTGFDGTDTARIILSLRLGSLPESQKSPNGATLSLA